MGLDPSSLRIAAAAETKISLGSIDAQVAPGGAGATNNELETRLSALRDRREAKQVDIDALGAKQAMMTRFAESGPEKLSPESKPLDIGQWNSAWDVVGAAYAKVGEELRVARKAARELDDEIKALESARQPLVGRRAARDVAVDVETPTAGKARFSLTYRVAGANWTPVYDARLETAGANAKPALEIVRRAAIAQRTGEDWTDVALSVSTTRTAGAVAAPSLDPQRIAFFEPPVVFAEQKAAPRARALENDGARAPASPMPTAAAAIEASETSTRVESDAYQATFVAPGRISAASDGSNKLVRLSAQNAEAALTYAVAPKLDPHAFLSAHFSNGETAPLLPGVVALYREGAYVGQGRMPMLTPGDSADLGFGADDRVRVEYAPVKNKENEPTWYGQTKTQTREFKTQVRNLHDFAVRAVVTDQAPFSENTAITVEILPQTTTPSEKQVGDKRGVMSWTLDLQPSETKEVRLAYRLKWPADREIVITPASR